MQQVKLDNETLEAFKIDKSSLTGYDSVVVVMEDGLRLTGYLINGKSLHLSRSVKPKKIEEVKVLDGNF